MNCFSKNKEIVKICKNYYDIVNSEIGENDKVTYKIIRLYEDFIFGQDIITKREVEKLELIDKIMYKFISDSRFKKELCDYFLHIRVNSGVSDLASYVAGKMIEFFNEYKDIYTRNIYIPRWI